MSNQEQKVIGQSIPRIDALSKVTGKTRYFTDFELPRMLWGKILRSPYAHARILSIDTSEAEKLSGVKAVITAEDTPKIKYGFYVADDMPLADEKVRFVGDEVAAVAAVDEATALKALSLIKVEYEELPAVFEPEIAMSPGAPEIHQAENNVAYESFVNRGDVDAAMEKADFVFEDTYTMPAVHACYLEPYVCVADWEDNKLNLWVPTQNPFTTRNQVAKALGIRPSDVCVKHQLEIGGGFGAKLDSKLPYIGAILARKAGYPIKLVNTREEEFDSACRVRVAAKIHLKMAVNKEGYILAKETEIIADNGAYSSLAPKIVGNNMVLRSDNLYRIPNTRTRSRLCYTNKIPSGAYRGYGNPQMHFAQESMLDRIAQELRIDPLEIRLKNAVHQGDVTVHGWELNSCGLTDCLKKVAEFSNWSQKKANKVPFKGIGLAAMIHASGNRGGVDHHGSEAIIKIQEDGRVQLITGEVDIGQGSRTVLSQIVAEELGIPLEEIEVLRVDTDTAPYVYGAYSSRTTHIAGNAVKDAARVTKEKFLKAASEILDVPAESLVLTEGKVIYRNINEEVKTAEFSEIARKAILRKNGRSIIGHGSWDPDAVLLGKDMYGNISTGYPFGVHVAEVEVDPETGMVKIIDYIAAHDSGKILNPVQGEGQIEGGVAQGLGYALSEQLLFDSQQGKVINGNFLDYKIPTSLDVPKIKTVFIEADEPAGPYGAKGLGEPTLIPVAPAIANAIYDAIGVQISSLPITPEKIIEALEKK